VSYSRRLTALFVDSVLVGLVIWLVATLLGTDESWVGIMVFLVYYPLFALLTHGRTPGKALVRIRLETVDAARPFWLLVLLRYLLRNALLIGCQRLALLISTGGTYSNIIFLAGLLTSALLVLDFFLSFRAKRGRRLWYEMLTRTRNVSSLQRTERVG
jgi:uncharacterized RDD family membrane protein YckC